jgi:hypothetical protein
MQVIRRYARAIAEEFHPFDLRHPLQAIHFVCQVRWRWISASAGEMAKAEQREVP